MRGRYQSEIRITAPFKEIQMKRTSIAGFVTIAASLAFLSTGAWAGLVYASEPLRDGSSTSGASSPVQVAPGPVSLSAAERQGISANVDGSVTHAQYTEAMERRWYGLAKNSSGNVPALPANDVDYERRAPPLMTVPNF
jgi:hypothetical protein